MLDDGGRHLRSRCSVASQSDGEGDKLQRLEEHEGYVEHATGHLVKSNVAVPHNSLAAMAGKPFKRPAPIERMDPAMGALVT